MKYFPLIWAGLWRKRTRTIFTMLSIVVAFLLFGLLQGINQGFSTVLRDLNVDRLYVSAKTNMTDGLPIAYATRIKAVPGVRALSHWTYFGGYFQDSHNPLPAFATDPEQLFQVYREIKVKPEYIAAMKKTRTGVLISDTLAKKYHWKIGDRIPVGTSIWTNKEGSNTWFFDVVGTMDLSATGGGFPGFSINHFFFQEAAAFGNGVVHYYLVGLNDPKQATQVAKTIDAMFANSSNETRTQTESELAQMQLKQLGDINFIVNAIVGAVLFTLLFLTANTMMQSVRERTSELAVLKPIFGNFRMPMIVVSMGAGMALLLAFISGFPPAWRAKRLNIVDALAGR